MNEKDDFNNRMLELSLRAERTGVPQATKFLTVAEQSDLLALKLGCEFFGGYGGAERRVAVFGADVELEPPIVCLAIRPLSQRFADGLTHRDFLGSLMALGIEREMLGDIIVTDNEGYLICLASIAPFIISSLTQVKHTTVRTEYAGLPETLSSDGGEEYSLVVASERLDAIIAAFWRLSREDAKALVERGLVFVDSRLVLKAGASLDEGARVSVRGKGRFVYIGPERETRKGKLRIRVTGNR